MSFKDIVAADVAATFLNPDEFASEHTIDGRLIRIIIDTDSRGRNLPNMRNAAPPSYAEGVSLWQLAFYVDPLELGYRPVEDQGMNFDNNHYRVLNVADEEGLYRITLEAYGR